MVACVERVLRTKFNRGWKDLRVAVFGATGVVGFASSIIAAQEGARVKLVAHRGVDRVIKSAAVSKERFGVDLEPAPGETADQKLAIIADAEVIFAAAAAGVRVISADDKAHARNLLVVADVNAVPPPGVDGMELFMDGAPLPGTNALGVGPLAIGDVKYKTEVRASSSRCSPRRNPAISTSATRSSSRGRSRLDAKERPHCRAVGPGACRLRPACGFYPARGRCLRRRDMRETAGAFRCLGAAAHEGFRAGSLLPALRDLQRTAERAPVGLVLGSGFEDTPKLVATLAKNFTLLGTGADAIAQAKHPETFFPLLDRLDIAHPETRLDAPDTSEGWVSKRIGGSGGSHVLDVTPGTPTPGRYFQRRLEGSPASLLAVACGHELSIVGFSRQWAVGTGPRPYRYGGAAGPARLGEEIEARMAGAAWALNRAIGLTGLVSFDFLLNGEAPFLLEVNPRPGATLDVFDDAKGSLFAAHVAACLGQGAWR